MKERQSVVTNAYEFLLDGKSAMKQHVKYVLYQYKVTTVPKIDKDKFVKIREQLLLSH